MANSLALIDELLHIFNTLSTRIQSEFSEQEHDVAFTARLMALYKAQENRLPNPLIKDPYAEHLAGDMTQYLSEYPFHATKVEYTIIRSYYIEQTLLKRFKYKNGDIQIVSFGAGLDTKPYRLQCLTHKDHFFEIDLQIIHQYKAKILHHKLKAKSLCNVKYISINLQNSGDRVMKLLIDNGFDCRLPTFWLFEGIVMYLALDTVESLLRIISNYSVLGKNEIFVDVPNADCDINHYQWALALKDTPLFFRQNGNWSSIECNLCGHYDQGRNISKNCCIFFNGTKLH
eukprot:136450_1